MTAWTKTPPTEPGWYWVRSRAGWLTTAELWRYCGEERWSGAHIGEGRTGAVLASEGVEFWPVRIEEPPHDPL